MFDNWQEAAYVATKRFKYGFDSNGEPYEIWPGQYFDKAGYKNDSVLFGMEGRWVTTAPGGKRADWACDRCGRHFAGEGYLRHHQQLTASVENESPERVAELKTQAATRATRRLQSETMADLAVKQGHNVKIGDSGVSLVTYG